MRALFERSMRKSSGQRELADTAVRIGTSSPIPNVLLSLGADPKLVLGEIGYDLEFFENPENRISLEAHHHILRHCVTRTGCPHFGLLVGQEDGLRSLGLLGLLVRYSPDVETGLRSLAHYLHLHARGRTSTLVVNGNTAMFTYEVREPGLEAVDQIGDAAVAVMHNIMRELCGSDWRPTEAWFAHREPTDVGPFRRFFRVPLRFDAEKFALLFSTSYLKRRPTVVDDELRRVLQGQIDLLQERNHGDFPERVRNVLSAAIMTGHARADQIAALLGMHTRTLHRHLDAFGLGFQQLVDERRFEISRQMLENSAMEVGEIATLLDYAAPGAFTRAFRRWSGTTPLEWRAVHKGTG